MNTPFKSGRAPPKKLSNKPGSKTVNEVVAYNQKLEAAKEKHQEAIKVINQQIKKNNVKTAKKS